MRKATYAILATYLYLHTVYATNPLVVITIDGLSAQALEKASATNILQIIKSGTSFPNAQTIRPALALPAHTSMLTGLDPSLHGIFWDQYLPAYGPVRFSTALEIANNSGLYTAMFVAEEKLLHLYRPNSVDHFEKTAKEAAQIALAFKRFVNLEGLPDVVYLQLPDPDDSGPNMDEMSKSYLFGIKEADDAVGSILKTIEEASPGINPNLIITASIGRPNKLSDASSNNPIPFIARGDNIASGIIKQDRIGAHDLGATILLCLGLDVPKNFMGKPAPILIRTGDTALPLSLGKHSYFGFCQQNLDF